MFGERRAHTRYNISRAAKFYVESGGLPRDCMITDISENGARLFSEAPEIPDDFVLLISADAPVRQECHVVWRLGHEIGVKFVTNEREQARQAAMASFQANVRATFQRRS